MFLFISYNLDSLTLCSHCVGVFAECVSSAMFAVRARLEAQSPSLKFALATRASTGTLINTQWNLIRVCHPRRQKRSYVQVYGFCIRTLRLPVISVMIIEVVRFSYSDRSCLTTDFGTICSKVC